MNKILISMLTLSFLLISCSNKEDKTTTQNTKQETKQETKQDLKKDSATQQPKASEIKIMSKAFDNESMIPKKYACNGDNISPPLSWTDGPKGTKSFALIVDDPDAPNKTFVHWVVYSIPPDTRELPEKVADDKKLSNGSMQGMNGEKKTGYTGPCPPNGTHRYFFKIYALDVMPDIKGDVTKDNLLEAMNGHILAQGQLMGKYSK